MAIARRIHRMAGAKNVVHILQVQYLYLYTFCYQSLGREIVRIQLLPRTCRPSKRERGMMEAFHMREVL